MDARTTTSRAAWFLPIADCIGKSASRILEAGRRLAKARETHPRAEYVQGLRDFGYTTRWAEMYIAIGADERLAKYISLLPPCWSTLYYLTRISDGIFKAAVQSGTIRPDLRQEEARALVLKAGKHERMERAVRQNIGTGIELLLADPPHDTSYGHDYGTLSLQAIRDLRLGPGGKASTDPKHPSVAEVCAPCSAVALWVPDEMLHDVEAAGGGIWGHEFIPPRMIWHKTPHARAGKAALMSSEFLLIGVRGGAEVEKKFPCIIQKSRSGLRESEKPSAFYSILEEMFPRFTRRLELFARRPVPKGWKGWGDQYPGK